MWEPSNYWKVARTCRHRGSSWAEPLEKKRKKHERARTRFRGETVCAHQNIIPTPLIRSNQLLAHVQELLRLFKLPLGVLQHAGFSPDATFRTKVGKLETTTGDGDEVGREWDGLVVFRLGA